MQTKQLTESQTGCWIDNHNGHYVTPYAIELAKSLGFILDPLAEYVVFNYERLHNDEDFPQEALYEICDEAVAWLNSSPTEREIPGQNMPPALPAPPNNSTTFAWAFEDGDFGLWLYDLDTGEIVDLPPLG